MTFADGRSYAAGGIKVLQCNWDRNSNFNVDKYSQLSVNKIRLQD